MSGKRVQKDAKPVKRVKHFVQSPAQEEEKATKPAKPQASRKHHSNPNRKGPLQDDQTPARSHSNDQHRPSQMFKYVD